jgi:toxin FitB
MYLLDAGIVLELRKARAGRTDAGLTAWATGVAPQDMFLSAVSLLELESGAARLARTDKAAGAALRAWLDTQVSRAFDGRIVAVDAAVVRRCGQLAYEDSRNGLLAATALEHGLILVTRTPAAFRTGRVKVFNPWGFAPDASEDDADWRKAARAGPLWLKNLFIRT